MTDDPARDSVERMIHTAVGTLCNTKHADNAKAEAAARLAGSVAISLHRIAVALEKPPA